MPTDPYSFHGRKAARTEAYFAQWGWRERYCVACYGTGRYDHNGNPPCGACNGTGREKVRGPKRADFGGQHARPDPRGRCKNCGDAGTDLTGCPGLRRRAAP